MIPLKSQRTRSTGQFQHYGRDVWTCIVQSNKGVQFNHHTLRWHQKALHRNYGCCRIDVVCVAETYPVKSHGREFGRGTIQLSYLSFIWKRPLWGWTEITSSRDGLILCWYCIKPHRPKSLDWYRIRSDACVSDPVMRGWGEANRGPKQDCTVCKSGNGNVSDRRPKIPAGTQCCVLYWWI